MLNLHAGCSCVSMGQLGENWLWATVQPAGTLVAPWNAVLSPSGGDSQPRGTAVTLSLLLLAPGERKGFEPHEVNFHLRAGGEASS